MIMDIKSLQNPDGYTFDEGVAILTMCQASPGVVQHIMRTHNKSHLHSEIHKMLRMPGVMQLLRSKMPEPVQEPVAKNEVVAENTPEIATPQELSEKSEETSQEPQESSEKSDDNVEVKTMADVRRHKNTRLEDMPTELARDLWLKKQDKYHLQQQMHLKMREVPEGEEHNEERANYRSAVLELDADIDNLWKLIDAEIERFNTENQRADKGADGQPLPAFNVSTYRTYISKKLKKASLTDDDIVEVQHRVDEMLACGLKFSDELIAKMQAAGIRIG